MIRTLAILMVGAFAGCECDVYGTFTEGTTGTVYECRATAVDVLELCTDLSKEELERDTGWTCWGTTRLWPKLTGCIYGCYPHQGCNAHHGCYCPQE